MDASFRPSPKQIDALKELSHLGMNHATSALSQLLGQPLTLAVPEVSILSLPGISQHIGGKKELVAGLFLKVRGIAKGYILILLPRKSVISIIKMLTGRKTAQTMILSEEDASALKELGNILASAYLTALSNLLGIPLIPSIPELAFDMAGAVVEYLVIELGKMGSETIAVETRFENHENEVSGRLILFLDPKSTPAFLSSSRSQRSRNE
jgi:chemotaxis protein CheC